MRAIAFIPARGGSKRVPGKNLREVGGASLVRRAMCSAAGLDETVISTDDVRVANHAMNWIVEPATPKRYHERPPQLASDHAQIEDAIAHWWTRLDQKPDAIVLLQPTSPFRTAAHVREALRLLEVTGADSVVSVTAGHEPHFAGRLKSRDWLGPTPVADAGVQPRFVEIPHGPFFDWHPFADPLAERPRTQDMRPMGWENGSLYAFTRAHWERTKCRMGGHMVALPMTRWEGFDVDTEDDLRVANALVAGGIAQ